jgi:excisionase family DNA binding protein
MEEPVESTQPVLMTITQVASSLGVCRSHVYRLIAEGLPIIRLGRLVRINTSSLQQWLKDREQTSQLL